MTIDPKATSFIEQYFDTATNLSQSLHELTIAGLQSVMAAELTRIWRQNTSIDSPGSSTRIVQLMLAHLAPPGRAVVFDFYRARDVQKYADAIICFPRMLHRYDSVRAVLNAWKGELKDAVRWLQTLDQPHRPVTWESDNRRYRLTELIHPAHLAIQGILQRNCLVCGFKLMSKRNVQNADIAEAVPIWPHVKDGTTRVFSLDRPDGAVVTILLREGMLCDVEGAGNEKITPWHTAWDMTVEALVDLHRQRILTSGLAARLGTAQLTKELSARCGLPLDARKPGTVIHLFVPPWAGVQE